MKRLKIQSLKNNKKLKEKFFCTPTQNNVAILQEIPTEYTIKKCIY